MKNNKSLRLCLLLIITLLLSCNVHSNKNNEYSKYSSLDTIEIHQTICINCMGLSETYLILNYNSCKEFKDSNIILYLDSEKTKGRILNSRNLKDTFSYKYKIDMSFYRGRSINYIIKNANSFLYFKTLRMYSSNNKTLLDSFQITKPISFKYYLDENLINVNDSIPMNIELTKPKPNYKDIEKMK